MSEQLKIDDVAKQSGLSKRTIRYYEEIGLLPPPKRSSGGTRLYGQEHVEYLQRIIIAKEVLGFSLQELQHFMSLSETLDIHRADYKKVTDPGKQKEKLNEIIEIVNHQLEMIEGKIQKIRRFQTELITLRERAQAAIRKIDEEPSKP